MPRMPWRWILLGAAAFVVIGGGYWLKERRKANALRAELITVHEEQLAQAGERYEQMRERLDPWILEAAQTEPEGYVHPKLNLSGLRAGQGLYLRLPKDEIEDRESIAEAASEMTADAIGRCLGLTPPSARGIYEKGEFLLPEWIEQVHETNSVMRLRVIDDELAVHIRRDLPTVLNLLQAEWFMLVLQHGATRATAPVDVFLWDIRSGKNLLRARVQAEGALISARYVGKGAKPAPRAEPDRGQAAADDCSIAAKLKALTGEPMATATSAAAASPEAEAEQDGATRDDATNEREPSGEVETPSAAR